MTEYDQDVDTDEEPLKESVQFVKDNYQSAMREFFAIPKKMQSRMLKNSDVQERVGNPEWFEGANGQKKEVDFGMIGQYEELDESSTPMFGIQDTSDGPKFPLLGDSKKENRDDKEDFLEVESVRKSLFFDSNMSP
tara:strand:- start:80 stop:487 length:408 start_codon:yes stop_codon:yes gene_type:complete